MKNLTPLFAGIAVISGIVSANMWRELRAERAISADLRTQLVESKGVSRPPTVVYRTVEAPPQATSATASKDAPEKAAVKPAQGAPSVSVNTARMIEDSGNLERELMKDPEYVKARLAQTRNSMRRSYPGLAEELGISEREVDQIFDLMAQNQMDMQKQTTELRARYGDQPDQAAMAEISRTQQTLQREMNDQIAASLGPQKFQQYQDYQQTRPARTRVTSVANTLGQAGQPLTEAQMKPMTAAMIEFQKRDREEQQAMFRNVNATTPEARAQMLEEMQKRQENSNRRMLEAMAPHLNARQLATMKSEYEMQDAMNRASRRVQRAREEAQGTNR